MTYSEIENKIVERLKEYLPGYEVVSYPSRPEDFQFTHPLASILVKFQSTQYVKQAAMINYEVHIISRSLIGAEGYDLLEKTRDILTKDFEINGTRFYVTSEQQYDYLDGKWFYRLSISLPFLTFQGY
jgi:hypothetical protein